MNQKMIPFRFLLRFFWPTIPELIPENSQGIRIVILLESESTQPYPKSISLPCPPTLIRLPHGTLWGIRSSSSSSSSEAVVLRH